MANVLSPLQTGEGRIFINVDGFGGTTAFEFHNCMKIDGLDKTIGEAEPVYCPDPYKYDSFIEVAVIQGAETRWSSSLSGKLYGDRMSPLEILSNQRCPFNLQVHYGRCSRPDDFNAFDSAIVLEDVRISSYALSSLTAANPGERALIEETSSISAGNMYRIFNPQVSLVDGGQALPLVGLASVDTRNCGDACLQRSDGTQVWAYLAVDDFLTFKFTTNGGMSWATNTSNTADGNFSPVMINDGNYFYIGQDTKVFRVSVNSAIREGSPSVETIATLAGVTVIALASTDDTVWVLGSLSTSTVVYAIDKSSGTVTLKLTKTTTVPYTIEAYDDDTVAFTHGAGTAVISYLNSSGSFTDTGGLGAAAIIELKMLDETRWVYLSSLGIFASGDAGITWQNRLSLPSIPNCKMTWYDTLTGYLLSPTAIYRTIDSGRTWKVIATITGEDAIAIAVSGANPNIFMAQTKTGLSTFTHKSRVGN